MCWVPVLPKKGGGESRKGECGRRKLAEIKSERDNNIPSKRNTHQHLKRRLSPASSKTKGAPRYGAQRGRDTKKKLLKKSGGGRSGIEGCLASRSLTKTN